jgi:hypothetical protein
MQSWIVSRRERTGRDPRKIVDLLELIAASRLISTAAR